MRNVRFLSLALACICVRFRPLHKKWSAMLFTASPPEILVGKKKRLQVSVSQAYHRAIPER